MSYPRFIAIHGLKESGKSTTAEVLMERHGYVRVKMADALKNMIRSLLRDAGYDNDYIERCIEGDLKNESLEVLGGKTCRYAMQTLGTEWRDMILMTLWVNIAASKIGKLLEQGQRVVVDDLRFPHEIDVLNKFCPAYWVVTRHDGHLKVVDGHKSEEPLPMHHFHVHLRNDGNSIPAYQAEVESVLALAQAA